MAGIKAVVTTTSTEIALSAATAKTVLQLIAPANQRLLVKGLGVFFDGTEPLNQPVEIYLVKQSTAGTMTAATPVRETPGNETVQATAAINATAEPTTASTLRRLECHPQSGYEVLLPLGEEIVVAGGERLGLICNAPQAVNCHAYARWEE